MTLVLKALLPWLVDLWAVCWFSSTLISARTMFVRLFPWLHVQHIVLGEFHGVRLSDSQFTRTLNTTMDTIRLMIPQSWALVLPVWRPCWRTDLAIVLSPSLAETFLILWGTRVSTNRQIALGFRQTPPRSDGLFTTKATNKAASWHLELLRQRKRNHSL